MFCGYQARENSMMQLYFELWETERTWFWNISDWFWCFFFNGAWDEKILQKGADQYHEHSCQLREYPTKGYYVCLLLITWRYSFACQNTEKDDHVYNKTRNVVKAENSELVSKHISPESKFNITVEHSRTPQRNSLGDRAIPNCKNILWENDTSPPTPKSQPP